MDGISLNLCNFTFTLLNEIEMKELAEGMKAPEFTGKDQRGKEISLRELQGRKVILYFYPKDDTPGCTAEACNLRDNYSELIEKGFEVVGISADSEKSHQRFIDKYNLPFNLVSDTDRDVLKAYGAWVYGPVFLLTSLGALQTARSELITCGS